MIITNKLNMPEAFVKAISNSRHNADKCLSATTLLKGTKEIILTDRHFDEITIDASDEVWAVFGIAVHEILEHQEDEAFKEESFSVPVWEGSEWKITGKVDRYYGIIIDGLEELKNTLSDTLTDQIEFIDDLNRRFGARIINYMTQEQIYSVLNDSQMADLNVWREFRKEIVIARSAFADYAPIYSGAQMTEILQEEVKIAEL